MFERFARDTRSAVADAVAEASRRGDRKVGTEHLLLGLLDDPAGVVATVLALDVESGRGALDALDADALASVGIDVAAVPARGPHPVPGRLPFTASAKDALARSLRLAAAGQSGHIEPGHLLLALLERPAPDPVSVLLDRLGVDRTTARARLAEAA